jgi:hypothetical protein
MPYLSPTEHSNLMGEIDRAQTKLNMAITALQSCENHFEEEQPFDDLEACARDEDNQVEYKSSQYRDFLNLRQKVRTILKTF